MTTATTDFKRNIVRDLYQLFGDNRLDLIDDLVDPRFVDHNPLILGAPTGVDALRGGLAMLRESFPDLIVEVEDLIAGDDKVVARLRMLATNTGDYRGGPAGTRHAEWSAISIWRLTDGRLAESWGTADRFGMLQQLGMLPSDEEMAAQATAEAGASTVMA